MIAPAIYFRLANTPAITDIVGDRVMPVLDPEDTADPCVIYDVAENQDLSTGYGVTSNLHSYTVNVAAIARKYLDAQTLAQAVRDCLDGQSGTWGTVKVTAVFFENESDSSSTVVTDSGEVKLSIYEQQYTVIVTD